MTKSSFKTYRNKQSGEIVTAELKNNKFDSNGVKLILSWTEELKEGWITFKDEYFDDVQDFEQHFEEVK